MKEEIFCKIVEEVENLSDGKYIRAKWISQSIPGASVQSVARVWIKGPSLTGAH